LAFFAEKRQIFLPKIGKMAENCHHNIDPWSPCHRLKIFLLVYSEAQIAAIAGGQLNGQVLNRRAPHA
jgi:hypothetical protein